MLERAEMEVNHAADGVVTVIDVLLKRHGAKAAATPEVGRFGTEPPTSRVVSAHLGSGGAEPGIGGQDSDNGAWRRWNLSQFRVERQDPGSLIRLPLNDHAAPEIRRPAPLGVDPLASADVCLKLSDQAQVVDQLVKELVGIATADHHEVDVLGKVFVMERRKLDEIGPEGLEGFERIGKVPAKGAVARVSHAKRFGVAGASTGTSPRRRAAPGEGADGGEVGELDKALGETREDQVGLFPVERAIREDRLDIRKPFDPAQQRLFRRQGEHAPDHLELGAIAEILDEDGRRLLGDSREVKRAGFRERQDRHDGQVERLDDRHEPFHGLAQAAIRSAVRGETSFDDREVGVFRPLVEKGSEQILGHQPRVEMAAREAREAANRLCSGGTGTRPKVLNLPAKIGQPREPGQGRQRGPGVDLRRCEGQPCKLVHAATFNGQITSKPNQPGRDGLGFSPRPDRLGNRCEHRNIGLGKPRGTRNRVKQMFERDFPIIEAMRQRSRVVARKLWRRLQRGASMATDLIIRDRGSQLGESEPISEAKVLRLPRNLRWTTLPANRSAQGQDARLRRDMMTPGGNSRMGATSLFPVRFATAIVVLNLAWMVGAVPPPPDSSTVTTESSPDPASTRAEKTEPDLPPLPETVVPAAQSAKTPPPEIAKPRVATDTPLPDRVALRAQTLERLAKLPKLDDKDAKLADKNLREILETRLKFLEAWDAALKERAAAENPQPNPDDEAADLKADLERTKTQLAAAVKDRKTLILPNFRNLPAIVPESTRNEIKEAISAGEIELKETAAKFEELRSPTTANKVDTAAAIRVNRDKQTQKIATLKAKIQEREKALVEAINNEAREPAREKLLNAQCESILETEKLKAMEASLNLAERRSAVRELGLKVYEARVSVATLTLQALKDLHRALSVREERSLQRAAVIEKSRADLVNDPLERYRAKRSAELLELQATVIADENALTLNPPPTFDEQHTLAIHAQTDLENVKHLLDDGRVSHLDALRLNNDFRRIGIERERIEKNELARTASRLANAENALSRVEIEMVYDGRDDRFELDNLLERLPKPDHPKLIATFEEFEREHMKLLNRRQIALEKLATRAEETHDQVLKRLRVLDEHFGFIRTHIFWVRDEEPVSATTFSQANREAFVVAHSLVRLIAEFGDRTLWGRFSPEFLISAMGVVLLPWPLRRLSRYCQLRREGDRSLRPGCQAD